MKRSDLNHLRRLVAWVRCEIDQDPAEMQKTMIDIADKLGHPEVSDEGKARLVERYRRAAAVPQYVRDAIKALDRYARPPGQDGGPETRRAAGETRADTGSDGGPASINLQSMIGWMRRRQGWPQVIVSGQMAGDIADMLSSYGGRGPGRAPALAAPAEILDDSLITEIAFEERMENVRADIPDRVFSFARAIERAVVQAQSDPYRENQADQADIIDMGRLSRWLTAYGISTPVSMESFAASFGEQVNALTRLEPFPGWRPIETAPKDGTWILAWRGPATGGYWDPMVIVRWYEWPEEPGEAAWAWPDDSYDVWTPEGRRRADGMMMSGALFEDDSFTHWMPLPQPPVKGGNHE